MKRKPVFKQLQDMEGTKHNLRPYTQDTMVKLLSDLEQRFSE